jgi:intracellular sulfur oxidation DsrE/DsrF family protein
MRSFAMLSLALGLFAAVSAQAQEPEFVFPLIRGYGGIAVQPAAAEPPQAGAKIVFDITADSSPVEVNRALESVARYLNLNAQAGNKATDLKLGLVLHGKATRCALSDAAYARVTAASDAEPASLAVDKNPNRPLLAELKKHGVELYVCGQSLARNKYALRDVASELTVAASAMTVNVNKQRAGYAYLSLH